jgi:hypothetical protein
MTEVRVFITHRDIDHCDASVLASTLRDLKLATNVDVRPPRPDAPWYEDLKQRLDACDFVIVLWADELEASVLLRDATEYALTRGKSVLPIVRVKARRRAVHRVWDGLLSKLQVFHADAEDFYERLGAALETPEADQFAAIALRQSAANAVGVRADARWPFNVIASASPTSSSSAPSSSPVANFASAMDEAEDDAFLDDAPDPLELYLQARDRRATQSSGDAAEADEIKRLTDAIAARKLVRAACTRLPADAAHAEQRAKLLTPSHHGADGTHFDCRTDTVICLPSAPTPGITFVGTQFVAPTSIIITADYVDFYHLHVQSIRFLQARLRNREPQLREMAKTMLSLHEAAQVITAQYTTVLEHERTSASVRLTPSHDELLFYLLKSIGRLTCVIDADPGSRVRDMNRHMRAELEHLVIGGEFDSAVAMTVDVERHLAQQQRSVDDAAVAAAVTRWRADHGGVWFRLRRMA